MRAAVAALLLVATAAGGPEEPLTEDARKAFDWFDALGYPDLANAPFVRIYVGHWQGEPPEAVPEYGFLLGDDRKRFHVFTVGLETLHLTPTGPKKPVHERVAYEKTPLADYVRGGLNRLANPPKGESPWEYEPFGHREFEPALWFRVLVFARACAQQGHGDLAHQLWQLVERDEVFRGDGPALRPVQEQVAREALRVLVRDYGDPELSWADLEVRCRRWKEKFGALVDPKSVNAVIPMFESDIAAPAVEPADTVARLILDLRDASCRGCYGVPEGAGRELVAIGRAAVPQLLDAWDDERPSRSVGWEPSFKGYIRDRLFVVPVSTHVRAIIEEIAGKSFSSAVDARLWDARVRGLDAKAVLVRMVSEGCRDAAEGARLLRERHPDVAEAAILAGLGKSRDRDARSALVAELRTIRTEAAMRFLLDELRAADADRRAQAAWLLLDRGRADGVHAVVEAWRGGSESMDVSWFLCNCGRSEAVAAVEERFDSVSVEARFDIVHCFTVIVRSGPSSMRWWPFAPGVEPPAPDPNWQAGVESLLVHALADAAHLPGWGAWRGGMCPEGGQHPRVCDVAACALRDLFRDRYDFDEWDPVAQRDRQIIKFRNRWRRAHGLPALPAPR